MRLLILLCLVGGLSSMQAQSDEPLVWTLQQCIDYAMENNIQVQTSELQVEVTENNLSGSKWNYAPSVRANSNTGWNYGLNIDPVTNLPSRNNRFTTSMSISGSWVIFDGGRKINNISRNNLEYMAAMYDYEAIKNDISLNVTSAYLQILLNQEIFNVAKEQEKISQLQVDQTSKLVDAGSAPRGDLLQVEAQLARDQQNTVATENAVLISKLNLANLLQLDQPEKFATASPQIDLPSAAWLAYAASSIYDTAVNAQPSVKAAQARIESSEEAIDLNQGGYFPTIALQGQIGTNYSDQIIQATNTTDITRPVAFYDEFGNVDYTAVTTTVPTEFESKEFGNQVNDNLNQYVGFNISFPIFNQMQVKNNVQNARIQREISGMQLEQEKNRLRQIIYQAHADAKASYNSYLAAEKSVNASRESFNYAQERYTLGAISQFEFENTKNSLAIAQADMFRTKFDYIFKIKVLEFYLTNKITL